MARFCAQDGITHIAATPHCHRFLRLLRADILPHVARINEELEQAGVPLAILPGSEVQVTDSAAYRRDFQEGLYLSPRRRPSLHPAGVQLGREALPIRCGGTGGLVAGAG